MSARTEAVLSQLADIELPPEAGWWPLAPGWWWLGLFLVLAFICALVWAWLRHRRRRYLREALSELARLAEMATTTPAWYGELNRLLKRVARVRYPDAHTDSLSGHAWSQFLADTSSLGQDACQQLVRGAIQANTGLPHNEAVELTRQWIREQS